MEKNRRIFIKTILSASLVAGCTEVLAKTFGSQRQVQRLSKAEKPGYMVVDGWVVTEREAAEIRGLVDAN